MSAVTISYPGLNNIVGCTVTLSRGCFPSAALIHFVPQDNLNLSPGDLTITQGSASVTLANCTPELASLRIQKQGEAFIQSIVIFDRRRDWQHSRLTQDINRRFSDGDIPSAAAFSKLTANQLAEQLLAACGETVGRNDLPSDAYPRLSAVAENAAWVLDKLCDDHACEIVLNESNVDLVGRENGSPLPPDSAREITPEYNFSTINGPSTFTVDGGPTLWDGHLVLEPVALETNGTYKSLDDSTLSYAPSGGWSKQHPMAFAGVQAGASRDLALRSVYRIFRVKGMAGGSLLSVPLGETSSITLTSAAQIKLQDHRLAVTDSLTGTPKPAQVWGKYWGRGEAFSQDEDGWRKADCEFRIDTDNGLVIFDEFMCGIKGFLGDGFKDPELVLHTSFMVEDDYQLVRGVYAVDRQGVANYALHCDSTAHPNFCFTKI